VTRRRRGPDEVGLPAGTLDEIAEEIAERRAKEEVPTYLDRTVMSSDPDESGGSWSVEVGLRERRMKR
jgi:hypothetical protein